MTRDQAELIVNNYDALMGRALAILAGGGPPWGYVSKTQWARLRFEGDDAIIDEPKADSYYDSCSIESDETKFPAKLLFMSDDELAAWKVDAKKKYDEEQRLDRAAKLAQQEASERATLKALKRKYGQL